MLGGAPTDLLVARRGDRRGRPGPARRRRGDRRAGLVALPGLVDLHTHLREPGREDAETVESGSRAAALGGYTAVCAMANTDPVADTAGVVEQVWRLGREAGLVDVQPVGAVTVGLAGERLAELGAMADSAARVRIFSDDGHCVSDPRLMRRALEYVKAFDGVIAQHAEEPRLTAGAQMHEGAVSARLGLPGWPAVAEEAIIARDVLLAGHVGRAAAHLPRLHRRQRGDPALGQVQGLAGHRRGHPAPPAAHRRPRGRLRPGVQGEPAAAHGRGRGRAAGRPRRGQSTRSPPTTPRTPWRTRSASGPTPGRACSAWRRPVGRPARRWASMARASPSGCRAAPARIAGLAGHGQDPAPGEPANLTLVDPTAPWTVDPTSLASRCAQHAVRRPGPARPGRRHVPARRADGPRREGSQMRRPAARFWCSRTAGVPGRGLRQRGRDASARRSSPPG